MAGIGDVWKLARSVEDLLKLQTSVRTALEAIDGRLRSLEDRMVRIEAEERQVVTEAKSAAQATAMMISGNFLSDVVTRVTKLEVATGSIESKQQRRLPKGP